MRSKMKAENGRPFRKRHPPRIDLVSQKRRIFIGDDRHPSRHRRVPRRPYSGRAVPALPDQSTDRPGGKSDQVMAYILEPRDILEPRELENVL